MAICTCPVSDERFDVPLWIQMRENPVVKAETSLRIGDGKTVLSEIPRRLEGISVIIDGVTLTEIRDQYQELGDLEYRVNYNVGWIFFNADFYPDGSIINAIEYTARGIVLYPLSRIIDADGNPLSEVSLTDIYDDGILVKVGAKKLDFRQNIEVEADPTDSTRVIINVLPDAGFAGHFLDLSDSPSTYVGQAGKGVIVNSAEDGIEFSDTIAELETKVTYDSIINSTFDVLEPIKGLAQLDTMYGLSLNQQNLLGDVESSLSYASYFSQDASGNLAVNTSYQSGNLTFNIISGNTYFVRIKMDSTSVNVLRNEIIIFYSDAAYQAISNTLSDDELTIYGKFTANKSLLANITIRGGAAGTQLDNLSWELIDITNTPYYDLSADELNLNIVDYFEGNKDIEDFELSSAGVNLFDKLDNIEVGDIDSATGIDSVNTGRNRTSLYTPVIAEQTYSIVASVWQGAFYYDSNFNPIDYGGATFYEVLSGSTFTPVAGACYVRFRSLSILTDEQIDTFIINEGTTLLTYTAYNSPQNFKAIATARSVGTDIRDEVYPLNGAWWYKQKVYEYTLTEDDITLLFTAPSNVDTVTIVKQLDDILYDNDDDFTASSPVFYDGFTVGIYSDSTSNIGIIYNLNITSYSIIVANGTYADLAAAKTALAGTIIRYQLATPLTPVEIATHGSIIQESVTTLVQIGNFATTYDITFAESVSSGVKNNAKEIIEIKHSIDTPIMSANIPYATSQGSFDTSKDGAKVAIFNENEILINGYIPSMLNQIIIDGDDFATNWTLTLASGSITDGIYSFTATAIYGRISQVISFVSDADYFIKARISTNGDDVYYGGNTGETQVLLPNTAGEFIDVNLIGLGGTATNIYIIDKASSGWGEIKVDYIMAIPLPSYITTAEQMEDILDGEYFEGIVGSENISITSINKNKFDVDVYNQFDDYTVATYYRLAFDNLVVGNDYYISTNVLKTLPTTLYMVLGDDFHTAGTNPISIITNSVEQNISFTATEDHKYIKVYTGSVTTVEEFIGNMAEYIEIQIEEGSEATEYEEFKSSTLDINGTMYRLTEDVYDDLDTQRIGRDYNDVVQEQTSWGKALVLTNTHGFYKNLTSLLDYDIPNPGVAPNATLIINGVTYTAVSQNDMDVNDVENTFAIYATSNLAIRVNKTTYATSGDFETYLQANDVEFIFELAAPIARELPQNGALIINEDTTYIHSGSGVIGEFTLSLPLNTNAQIVKTIEMNVEQTKDIKELQDIKVSSNDIDDMPVVTQAYYDALVAAGTTDPRTFYVIVG